MCPLMHRGSYFRFSWDLEERRQSKANKRAASKGAGWLPKMDGRGACHKKKKKKKTRKKKLFTLGQRWRRSTCSQVVHFCCAPLTYYAIASQFYCMCVCVCVSGGDISLCATLLVLLLWLGPLLLPAARPQRATKVLRMC